MIVVHMLEPLAGRSVRADTCTHARAHTLPPPARPNQVRALVHKYPLILNFHPESVESAALVSACVRVCVCD